jgi:hypothetical protein
MAVSLIELKAHRGSEIKFTGSAFWTNGPNWPVGGEIDIVEGVNDYTNDQATIHTTVGCTIPSTDQNVLDITGTVIGLTDCSAANTGNQGCGVRASQSNSFGAAFNANGGGTYASEYHHVAAYSSCLLTLYQ